MSHIEKQPKEPNQTNKKTPWFSTDELLEYLGISSEDLKKQTDLFTEGIHYKLENPDIETSRILWRLDLVDELLCLPVPPLEKEAMLKAINNHITCKE